jgi:hypothetical protein
MGQNELQTGLTPWGKVSHKRGSLIGGSGDSKSCGIVILRRSPGLLSVANAICKQRRPVRTRDRDRDKLSEADQGSGLLLSSRTTAFTWSARLIVKKR